MIRLIVVEEDAFYRPAEQSGQPKDEGKAGVEPTGLYGVDGLSRDPDVRGQGFLGPFPRLPEGLDVVSHAVALVAAFVITAWRTQKSTMRTTARPISTQAGFV